jgi:hypothetical protein
MLCVKDYITVLNKGVSYDFVAIVTIYKSVSSQNSVYFIQYWSYANYNLFIYASCIFHSMLTLGIKPFH